MGKNASKNFVNQFKNTRRLAGRQAYMEPRKLVKGTARQLKKFFPGEHKKEKNPNRGDK